MNERETERVGVKRHRERERKERKRILNLRERTNKRVRT